MTIPIHHESNLFLFRPSDEVQLPVGKVCPSPPGFHGHWIWHMWVQSEWQRRDREAFGINEHLAAWLDAHGVQDLVIYLPRWECTRATTLDVLMGSAGMRTKTPWGYQINLPWSLWESVAVKDKPDAKHKGLLPVKYVPASIRTVITIPVTPDVLTEAISEPVEAPVQQFSLFT